MADVSRETLMVTSRVAASGVAAGSGRHNLASDIIGGFR
jgi:hypothetical protein